MLAYGSVINNRATKSSDIDLFLLLDEFNAADISNCNSIIRNYKNVDLSLQYLDQLPKDPSLIQDGTKGASSLVYLSSAETLLGKNIFHRLFRQMPKTKMKAALKITINQYLLRMRTFTISCTDSEECRNTCLKYFTRLLVDIMLYHEGGDMYSFKTLSKKEIVGQAVRKNYITSKAAKNIERSTCIDIVGIMESLVHANMT